MHGENVTLEKITIPFYVYLTLRRVLISTSIAVFVFRSSRPVPQFLS